MEIDLLANDAATEAAQHKLKRLVQSPDSFFMDVKCPQCQTVNTIFSHVQGVCLCKNCKYLLAVPRGGKTKLAVGTAWRRKGNWAHTHWSLNQWTRNQKLEIVSRFEFADPEVVANRLLHAIKENQIHKSPHQNRLALIWSVSFARYQKLLNIKMHINYQLY